MRECCGGPSGDSSRSPINVSFTLMVVVAVVIVKLIKKVIQHVPSPQQMVYLLYSRWLWNYVYLCTGATLLSWFGPGIVYTSILAGGGGGGGGGGGR